MSEESAPRPDAAPPLADAADPGYAERLAKLRNRAESIIKGDGSERCSSTAPSDPTVRCVRPAGHNGYHQSSAQLANGRVRWSDSTDSDVIEPPKPFCGQRDPNYPDDGCCTLRPGHPRWQDSGDGDVWDHARLDANGEMITAWNVPAEPVSRCGSRPVPGGWATPVDRYRCEREAGHSGEHRDGPLTWKVGMGSDQLVPPRLKLDRMRVVDDPGPVRVRFVALPPRIEPRQIDGLSVDTIRPGGFALIVDRFRTLHHRDHERPTWDEFGATIGAHTVLCYQGELSIAAWFDAD